MKYIYSNQERVSGRALTGLTISKLAAQTGYGAMLGPTLSLAAIHGDVRYAVEAGLDKLEGLEKAILGGDLLGIPSRENCECK